MIYITGDTHQDFTRFTENKFPIQAEMTKDDYVIICGDFGGVWIFAEESSREKESLDWLNNKNFTTLFVNGNHEIIQDYIMIIQQTNGMEEKLIK